MRWLVGPPLEEGLQENLRGYGNIRVTEAVAAYRLHYGESGYLGSVAHPAIKASIESMKAAGLRLFLPTSERRAFALRSLDHLEFSVFFDGISGSVPGGKLDQKPELPAHLLAEEKLLPVHGVMVGDRRHDIAGARATGMRGFGVLWGYGTKEEPAAAGADLLLETPRELATAAV